MVYWNAANQRKKNEVSSDADKENKKLYHSMAVESIDNIRYDILEQFLDRVEQKEGAKIM